MKNSDIITLRLLSERCFNLTYTCQKEMTGFPTYRNMASSLCGINNLEIEK